MSCKFCGKTFNRRFNLNRHESDYCTLRHENSDTDDESQDMKSDASNSEHTQSSEADESESATHGTYFKINRFQFFSLEPMPSLAHAQAMYEIVICKVFSNLISVIHFCSRSRVDGRPPRHTRDKSRPSYTMGKKSPRRTKNVRDESNA